MTRGIINFTPGQDVVWGQHVTLRQPTDLADPTPIMMMVTGFAPATFYTNGGNVALTAVLIDSRVAIAATNLSETRLTRLQVTWWAFQP